MTNQWSYRNNYGEIIKVRTDTVELPIKGHEGYDDATYTKKPKIVVVMKRSADFFKNMEEFERIREEAIKKQEQEKIPFPKMEKLPVGQVNA